MSPAIHSGRRLWTAPSLIVIAVMLLTLAGCKKKNAYVAPPPPEVGVAHALQQPVTPYLEVTGNAEAINQIDLVARVEGFLQEIKFRDGAMVARGDTLFVIEPAPYELKVKQAQSSLAATEASLVMTEAELIRQTALARTDVSARSTVEQAQQKRDADKANLASLQAGVALAAITLGYTTITAPFAGQVSAHLADVGALVGVGTPTKLATLVQLDPVRVSFTVNEQDLLRIRAAFAARGAALPDLTKVKFEVGLMNETGYPHAGTLDYAAPQVDPATGTIAVRGVLANADHAITPGMFLRGRIPLVIQQATQFLLPERAIASDQSGTYVLIAGADGVVRQQPVQCGQTIEGAPGGGRLRVVSSGIEAGDQVIVSGLQKVIPGQKVVARDTPLPVPGKDTPIPAPGKP